MSAWEARFSRDKSTWFSLILDNRYEIRRNPDMGWRWALYFNGQSMHEVHASSSPECVKADAEELIFGTTEGAMRICHSTKRFGPRERIRPDGGVGCLSSA